MKQQWQNAIHWLQNEMERVSLTVMNDPLTEILSDHFCSDLMLVLVILMLDGHHRLSPMKLPMGMPFTI